MSGTSRRLGRLLQQLFGRAWPPASFVVHVAADLGAALFLLALLAVLLGFSIQLFNAFVEWTGGDAPLVLHGFLTRAVQQPWPDGIWAFSMLLTTMIPTAIHAGALIITLCASLIQPARWRQRMAEDLSEAALGAAWLVIVTPIVAGLVVVVLGYGLVWLIGALWQPAAELLLVAALRGMALADWLAHGLGLTPAP